MRTPSTRGVLRDVLPGTRSRGAGRDRDSAAQLQSACGNAMATQWETALLPAVEASVQERRPKAIADVATWAPMDVDTYPAGLQMYMLSVALVKARDELETMRKAAAAAAAAAKSSKAKIESHGSRMIGTRESFERSKTNVEVVKAETENSLCMTRSLVVHDRVCAA